MSRFGFAASKMFTRGFAADARDTPTNKLFQILKNHAPLTSEQCWEYAEKEGFRSKTHMKKLLHSMKAWGRVETKRPEVQTKGSTFIYQLPKKAEAI